VNRFAERGKCGLATAERRTALPKSIAAPSLGVEFGPAFVHPDRTLYRHRPAVLKHLGVTPWGAAARELAQSTMIKTAKARTDPADIINSAVDALIRYRCELPALIALRRLAGTAHSKVNASITAHLVPLNSRSEATRRSAKARAEMRACLSGADTPVFWQSTGRSGKTTHSCLGKHLGLEGSLQASWNS
jgi:hypothetical protein